MYQVPGIRTEKCIYQAKPRFGIAHVRNLVLSRKPTIFCPRLASSTTTVGSGLHVQYLVRTLLYQFTQFFPACLSFPYCSQSRPKFPSRHGPKSTYQVFLSSITSDVKSRTW